MTTHVTTADRVPKLALIGHCKDHSAYYLNLFPQWQALTVDHVQGISATPFREALLTSEDSNHLISSAESIVPQAVQIPMKTICQSEAFLAVKEEHKFVRRYLSAWEAAPYAPIFVTVDAVLVQNGHVLMVERKNYPGKGLLALQEDFSIQKKL